MKCIFIKYLKLSLFLLLLLFVLFSLFLTVIVISFYYHYESETSHGTGTCLTTCCTSREQDMSPCSQAFPTPKYQMRENEWMQAVEGTLESKLLSRRTLKKNWNRLRK